MAGHVGVYIIKLQFYHCDNTICKEGILPIVLQDIRIKVVIDAHCFYRPQRGRERHEYVHMHILHKAVCGDHKAVKYEIY